MRLRVAVPIALLIARARHQAQGSKKGPGRLSRPGPSAAHRLSIVALHKSHVVFHADAHRPGGRRERVVPRDQIGQLADAGSDCRRDPRSQARPDGRVDRRTVGPDRRGYRAVGPGRVAGGSDRFVASKTSWARAIGGKSRGLRNHPDGLIHRRGFKDLGTANLAADALERHAGG